ncbi:unnamed protein product [Mesocestoides corti]|uniref:GRAM domain-containing protein n=1 Tax=Mesocestoides corti TaxID=53468 RepID=A0A0R3U971_MESCO|nr:unnamed protein product [Mesocestoides corti]
MLADHQSSQAAPASALSTECLTNSILEFSYDLENGVTLESWQMAKTLPAGDLQQLFFQRRNSLCVIDGYLVFKERTVVPISLRLRVLCRFHTSHPGIGRISLSPAVTIASQIWISKLQT